MKDTFFFIIKWKAEGKRGFGKKKFSQFNNIKQWTEIRNMRYLINTERDREESANVIRCRGYGVDEEYLGNITTNERKYPY